VTDRLLIFARYPSPGRVKTRLVPPLDHAAATALYRAFLLDSIERWSVAGAYETVVCVADARDVDPMRRLIADELAPIAPHIAVRAQEGDDLGTRLLRAFEEALVDGCDRVCAIGSDHPTLPVPMLQSAFDRTNGEDVVVGPTDDGGYWLIGMQRAHAELLEGMPYSTAELCDATRARAGALGLSLRELGRWYDVDGVADLERLWRDREGAPPGRRTLAALDRIMPALVARGVTQ
jgi:uncharacterized protein